jgi:hypothetical protein
MEFRHHQPAFSKEPTMRQNFPDCSPYRYAILDRDAKSGFGYVNFKNTAANQRNDPVVIKLQF